MTKGANKGLNSGVNDKFTNGKSLKHSEEFKNSEYNTYKRDYDDGNGLESSHRDKTGNIIQRFDKAFFIETKEKQIQII